MFGVPKKGASPEEVSEYYRSIGRSDLVRPAPTPERPTTEEGEEEWAFAYLESVLPALAKEEYYREMPTRSMTYSAYLAGLREGKRLEWNAGYLRGCQIRGGEISALEAQLVSAQEEVRKLKEAAEILFNFEKQNLQIQQEIASLREENERLLGVCIQRMESERALSDESTRLRELLQVAEGALEFYANGEHFEYCGEDEFEPETISGEPENWLAGGPDAGAFQYEAGFVAGFALARLRSGKAGGKK